MFRPPTLMNGLNLTQTLRIYTSLVFMYPQMILTPYPNEWPQCKHYWDPKCVHSSLKLETY